MAPEKTTSTLRIEIAPRTILLVLGATAAIWLLGQLTAVLMVVIVALMLVGTFDPLVAWLENKGLRRGRALVLVFVIAAVALTGVILLMVPPLASQVIDLIGQAPVERAKLIDRLADYPWAKSLTKAIGELPLDDIGARAGGVVLGYSTRLLEMVGYGLSTLFLAIYLLADPVRSKGLLYSVIPRHHHVKLAKILLELKVIVGGYMRGQLITSLSIALFVFVILSGAGAENALAIALFAGLTDVIPFVGGYIATAPVVVAVTPHGLATTLAVLFIMFLYQEFESRILVPRVYGRTLRLPPAIVLIALLVGGTLAGILGALLALPLAAGMQMLIRELRLDLPGEHGQHEAEKEIDDRATEVYEQLTEGVPAAAAGLVAEELAVAVKKNEATHITTEMPAVTPT
ncbi:MAG TPA: AI-2E family transporter [Kofleriaceae bacterium]